MALLPLLDDEPEKAVASGQAAIDVFPDIFQKVYRNGMCKKLGFSSSQKDDVAIIQDLMKLMQEEAADYTLTFRHLSDLADAGSDPSGDINSVFELPGAFEPWLERWQKRLADEPQQAGERQAGMYSCNPAIIPRNHLVEEAIEAAAVEDDFEPFNTLVDVLAQPFEFNDSLARFATPPQPEQVVRQTFCGT